MNRTADGSTVYDVIVVGLGVMGAATCAALARRGRRVLGLEQFVTPHELGSSHGRTRIIRTAYYEHPAYVPLVRRSFELWYELEQLSGRRLLVECPCLSIARPDSAMLAGLRASVQAHGLAAEELSAAEIRRRYPPLRLGEEFVGILERQAGYLAVEPCVCALWQTAQAAGAALHFCERLEQWEASERSVRVVTERGTYYAATLVLTPGPWAPPLLARWGVPLAVMRQVTVWFDVGPRRERFRRDRFPIFIAEVPLVPSAGSNAGSGAASGTGSHAGADPSFGAGPGLAATAKTAAFYGLPMVDERGLKLARHYGAAELPSLAAMAREVTEADIATVRSFAAAYLPDAATAPARGTVCPYTVTPDRHFLIDRHPESPAVLLACGFSGHGFKFAPVIGEILADLATDGRTPHDIELFRLRRFAAAANPAGVASPRVTPDSTAAGGPHGRSG